MSATGSIVRWLHENHPLAEHRARMLRMATGYHRHRTNLKDVYDIVTDVLVEVARATATGMRVSGSTR